MQMLLNSIEFSLYVDYFTENLVSTCYIFL